MLPIERRNQILQILENKDMSKLEELHAQIPGVSISTLRRDIKALENEGKIEYLFGGAVRLCDGAGEVEFAKKEHNHQKEKKLIAELAAKEVHDNNAIYIDSGTTCTLLLDKIKNKKVTVYTTNTQVCHIGGNFKAEIILIGGKYNGVTSSLTGALTNDLLSKLRFDKSFFGMNGISLNSGYTTPQFDEAIKKQLIAKRTTQSFILADSSKFGISSNVQALELKDATLISDNSDPEIAKQTQIIFPKSKNKN